MKHTKLISCALCIATILLSLGGIHTMPVSGESRGGVLHVKVGGNGDCTSWEKACELQAALAQANGGDEIWVKEGTYKPTLTNDRNVSFVLVFEVALYGGFAGTETERGQRNWGENPTILSGDIGIAGDNSDNSYHVVYAEGMDASSILDGFTITAGNADGFEQRNSGGGMYLSQSSPALTNIIFLDNSASVGGGICNNINSNPNLRSVTFFSNNAKGAGGGMANLSSNPILIDVTFLSNAAADGGGMVNSLSSPSLKQVNFNMNGASNNGGGMLNIHSSNPTMENITFSNNVAGYRGGGLYIDNNSLPTLSNATLHNNIAMNMCGAICIVEMSGITITNAIIWSNTPDQIVKGTSSSATLTYTDIEGGHIGEGNINLNPLLGSLADNGGFTHTHALLSGSPAIDAGSPTVCPATDQRGYVRPIDGNGDGTARCDMGAYEYGSSPYYYNFLPLILKPPALILDPLVNGDFEDGKVGWTETATNARDLIVNSGFPGGVTPHSDTWAAWLGGDYYEDTSTISQNISIPVGRSMLHFWYWISAPEDCGHDFFTLSIGSDTLINWDLCIDSQTSGWVERSIDLSTYAGSGTLIAFTVALDDSDTSQVFIDDVSLEVP